MSSPGPDAGGSSPAVPVRCYANNTIMKTQDRDKQHILQQEDGREYESFSDILLSIISGRSRIF